MGGADGEAKQGAESEGQLEATEGEEQENEEEENTEPAESCEAEERDGPADVVRSDHTLINTL